MERTNLTYRIPLDKLRSAIETLQKNPRKVDAEIAVAAKISRRTVNSIRHVLVDAPELLPKLLNGELSIARAVDLLHSTNGKQERSVIPEMEKLRADLRAWLALTRDLLDSIEAVFKL